LANAHKDGLLPRVAGAQIQGARDYQEDNYRVLDLAAHDLMSTNGVASLDGNQYDHTLLILTDGMGGHVGGAKASHIIAAEFGKAFEAAVSRDDPKQTLTDCLHQSNSALLAAIEDDPNLDGMGTTLVSAYITNSELFWCSVGDSLLYILRNGALQRLNADHSMVPILEKMVAMGELSAKQAAVDPRRNALRSAIDGQDIELIDVPPDPYRLQFGDILILASDGLETLSDSHILNILMEKADDSVEQKTAALLQAVQDVDNPQQDNTTVILYEIHDRDNLTANPTGSEVKLDISDTALRERPPASRAVSKEQITTPALQRDLKRLFWPAFLAVSAAVICIILAVIALRPTMPKDASPLAPAIIDLTDEQSGETIEGVPTTEDAPNDSPSEPTSDTSKPDESVPDAPP